MFTFGERFASFLIAAAILFAAWYIHGHNGKRSKFAKRAGVILAFLAGIALLVTFVGGWMASLNGIVSGIFVAGLIIGAAIIVKDWVMDGVPDKPAFFAMLLLPACLLFGISGLPAVKNQIGDGGKQVSEQVGKAGDTPPAHKAPVHKATGHGGK